MPRTTAKSPASIVLNRFGKSSLVMIWFLICLSIVSTIAEHQDGQVWPNYLGDLSDKIHDYQSDESIKESNPFNEGFFVLTTSKTPSSASNRTQKQPCHSSESTIPNLLSSSRTEVSSYDIRQRRSVINDAMDINNLLTVDDDSKVLEALLRADPAVDGSGTSMIHCKIIIHICTLLFSLIRSK